MTIFFPRKGGLPVHIGTRRAVMWTRRNAVPDEGPPPATTFGQDDFTGNNTDPLADRVASGGGTWIEHTSYSVGDTLITDGNRARCTVSPTCFYHSGTPASADYDVSVGVVMLSDNDSSQVTAAGRIDTAANTMYVGGYTTSGNIWFINKFNAGTVATIGTAAANLTVGQEYTAKLEMRGTALKLYVDGVETVSGTDGTITAAGKAGFRMQGASGTTTGLHMDNFLAQDAA